MTACRCHPKLVKAEARLIARVTLMSGATIKQNKGNKEQLVKEDQGKVKRRKKKKKKGNENTYKS